MRTLNGCPVGARQDGSVLGPAATVGGDPVALVGTNSPPSPPWSQANIS